MATLNPGTELCHRAHAATTFRAVSAVDRSPPSFLQRDRPLATSPPVPSGRCFAFPYITVSPNRYVVKRQKPLDSVHPRPRRTPNLSRATRKMVRPAVQSGGKFRMRRGGLETLP